MRGYGGESETYLLELGDTKVIGRHIDSFGRLRDRAMQIDPDIDSADFHIHEIDTHRLAWYIFLCFDMFFYVLICFDMFLI